VRIFHRSPSTGGETAVIAASLRGDSFVIPKLSNGYWRPLRACPNPGWSGWTMRMLLAIRFACMASCPGSLLSSFSGHVL
jgi:hypothetical protein